MNDEIRFNAEDVVRTYDFLAHQHETEIRLIDPHREKPPQSIFVHSKDEFVKTCEQYNGKYNIYAGINERSPGGKNAQDVIRVTTIVNDADADHPKDQAATDDELIRCMRIKDAMVKEYVDNGFETPNVMMSGNGYQLWNATTPIDVANGHREEIQAKLQKFQKYFIEKFSCADAKIDNIGDLPRIIKVAGTMSVKGENTIERPHRLARWENYAPRKDQPALKDKILSLNIEEPKTVTAEPLNPLTQEQLDALFVKDEKLHKLYEGDITSYDSRSEAEMALVTKLVFYKIPKEQVFEIMSRAKLGKWNEAHQKYRELTYSKALQTNANNATTVIEDEDFLQHTYSTKQLLDKEIAPKKPIVQGLINEKTVNILGGTSGCGKSWFELDLALAISNGTKWIDKFDTVQKNVWLIDLEEDEQENQRRLKKLLAGKTLNTDNFYITTGTEMMITKGSEGNVEVDPVKYDEIVDFIEKKAIELVIIDVGKRLHGFRENEADDINKLFQQFLKKLRDQHNVTTVYLMHTRKPKGGWEDEPADRLRGSSDFRGLANSILFLSGLNENEVLKEIIVEHPKMKGGKRQQTFRVNFESDEQDNIKLVYGGLAEQHPEQFTIAQKFLIDMKVRNQEVIKLKDLQSWLDAKAIKKPKARTLMDFMVAPERHWVELSAKTKGLYRIIYSDPTSCKNDVESEQSLVTEEFL